MELSEVPVIVFVTEIEKTIARLSLLYSVSPRTIRRQYVLSSLYVESPFDEPLLPLPPSSSLLPPPVTTQVDTSEKSSLSLASLGAGDRRPPLQQGVAPPHAPPSEPVWPPPQLPKLVSPALVSCAFNDIEAALNGELSETDGEDSDEGVSPHYGGFSHVARAGNGRGSKIAHAYEVAPALSCGAEIHVSVTHVDGQHAFIRRFDSPRMPYIGDEISSMQPLPPVAVVVGRAVLVLAALRGGSIENRQRQRWRRGVIEQHNGNTVDVRLVDYGFLVKSIKAARLRALPIELASPPTAYLVDAQGFRADLRRFSMASVVVERADPLLAMKGGCPEYRIVAIKRYLPRSTPRYEAGHR